LYFAEEVIMDKILFRGRFGLRLIWTRQYQTTDHSSYKINYDHLREGTKTESGRELLNTSLPQTVTGNVKNVVGWRGGAERGFLAAYPDVIHVLTKEGTLEFPDMARWYLKVLTHNLGSTVLRQRFGMLVPITYRQLCPSASNEEMQLAHVLGWCVEMVRTAAILTTDTVALAKENTYGAKKDPERLTWAERHNLGNKAFNDALLIERGVFTLIKHTFGDSASSYYEAVANAQRSRVLGRALGYRLMDYSNVRN
jgi:hypothetical protein